MLKIYETLSNDQIYVLRLLEVIKKKKNRVDQKPYCQPGTKGTSKYRKYTELLKYVIRKKITMIYYTSTFNSKI